MLKTSYSTRLNHHRATERFLLCGLGIFLVLGSTAFAATPGWLKQAAQTSVPSYSDAPNAIVLLDERVTTVSPAGEVRTTFRKAYKILRPGGSNKGIVAVYFDSDTQLTFLRGWGITPNNEEFEANEGEAIETAAFSESLYGDTHYKVLQIPAAQTGSVIGYEYQQKQRHFVLQTIWSFQDEIPVRLARLTLELPSNWKYSAYWRNHATVSPQPTGQNRWTWEVTDLDGIRSEPQMPIWRSLAGLLALSFAPTNGVPATMSFSSWEQIGSWYTQLTNGRRETNAAIREKVRQIIGDTNDLQEQILRLASYVQHEIRYVAIEIGIGGYQPHAAQDVLASGYGDCKDKVTLLSTMLKEVGVNSYYVLLDNDRDYLTPDFPSLLEFNHVILAIRLPADARISDAYAIIDHPKLGRLLFFDPTDNVTVLGYLPPSLQSNYGLLVEDSGGELVKLPLMPAATNRLLRLAKLTLDKSGTLKGTVEEVRTGPFATELRQRFASVTKNRRERIFQDLLSDLMDGAVLTHAAISNLKEPSTALILNYEFSVPAYAQRVGNLFIFRSCVLGQKSSNLLEAKPRKQPVEFPHASSEGDVVTIALPADYTVEEKPESVKYDYGFAAYKNETTIAEHTLTYNRVYESRDLKIPLERLDELKQFYRQIADDERAYTIMKAP